MGPDLGAVFYKLFCETATLRILWDQFVILFATKRERLSILNQSSGTFFSLVQKLFWQHALLTLARLTDPHRTAGKSNVSVCHLPHLISDDGVKQKLFPLIEQARVATDFARVWRNRKIAHTDLDLFIGRTAEELPAVTRDQVERAIGAIGEVLSCVEMHYKGGTLWFKEVPCIGGAAALLHVLRDGLEAEEERRERIRNGTFTAKDIGPRPVV